MILLCAGVILSLFGSLPPGLISLSVAQTAIARTLPAALFLAIGAAFAEFFQAWLLFFYPIGFWKIPPRPTGLRGYRYRFFGDWLFIFCLHPKPQKTRAML